MELMFQKEDLSKYLQMLQGVASGRNTLPILSNILIRAGNGRIEMAATDLEVGIKVNVPGEITEEGDITVSARKLAEIVRELASEHAVKLSTVGNDRVQVESGDGVYKILGLPTDDFPPMPEIDGDSFTIAGELLISMIDKTEFAASTEEARYFLNGLYFSLTSELTKVVATDGRRLAVASSEALLSGEGEGESIGVIVPLKAIKEIAKIFVESPEVKISLKENQILFADDDATLISRLVDGEYPQYEKIIPDSNEIKIVVDSEKISGSLRRVSLFSNPKNRLLRVDVKSDGMRVSAKSPELGEAFETLDISSANGEIDIGFDAQYIKDALAHITPGEILLEFKDALSAVTLRPVESEDHLCLIMPMRLDA
ncbi:MAG: DNA polymerase III subunit beta [Candidatus Poribacteria bacterium]|nr:DNA polymerase III subunit beta [Candidatus Poribacteria bacterium]